MKNYLTGSVTSQVLCENFMIISCSVSLAITRIATDDRQSCVILFSFS